MKKVITPRYLTDKTKMIKIGDIYVQRTKSQFEPHHLGATAKKEKFWKVREILKKPDRTVLECKNERLTLRGHATHKFYLMPKDHNKLYSRHLESRRCFNFPLKNFKEAKPWMKNFHRKLGYKITPPGDDPILARALQCTPVKKKRKAECPPAPKKKRKVGRFTVTACLVNDEKEIITCTKCV